MPVTFLLIMPHTPTEPYLLTQESVRQYGYNALLEKMISCEIYQRTLYFISVLIVIATVQNNYCNDRGLKTKLNWTMWTFVFTKRTFIPVDIFSKTFRTSRVCFSLLTLIDSDRSVPESSGKFDRNIILIFIRSKLEV